MTPREKSKPMKFEGPKGGFGVRLMRIFRGCVFFGQRGICGWHSKIGGKKPKSAILIGVSIINPSILGVLPVFLGSHPCDLMIQNWYKMFGRLVSFTIMFLTS